MKYVKYSIFILLACFSFGVVGTKAAQLYINEIKIPADCDDYKTKEMSKPSGNTVEQYAVKQKCTDNWSGDDRGMQASLHKTSSVSWSSEYLNLPTNTKVYYGNTSEASGTYQLWLRATKDTWSKATFTGYWRYA